METETKKFSSAYNNIQVTNKNVALNYIVQSQNCDMAAALTEEMNKYPNGSVERNFLKMVRFGYAYGRVEGTINVHLGETSKEGAEKIAGKMMRSLFPISEVEDKIVSQFDYSPNPPETRLKAEYKETKNG